MASYKTMAIIQPIILNLELLEFATKDFSPALKRRIADRLIEAVTDIITIPIEDAVYEDDTQYPSLEEIL
jgi:hypothetical protein